jgi:ATP synthase protein I
MGRESAVAVFRGEFGAAAEWLDERSESTTIATVKNMLTQAIRPFRPVFLWQGIATAAFTLLAGLLAGGHGALSALIGGLIGIVTGLAFVLTLAFSRVGASAGRVVTTALRAEAVKILLTVALLWAVFAGYEQVAGVVFIASFAVSVILFSLASFARVQQVTTG